jgi:hypothetical protein
VKIEDCAEDAVGELQARSPGGAMDYAERADSAPSLLSALIADVPPPASSCARTRARARSTSCRSARDSSGVRTVHGPRRRRRLRARDPAAAARALRERYGSHRLRDALRQACSHALGREATPTAGPAPAVLTELPAITKDAGLRRHARQAVRAVLHIWTESFAPGRSTSRAQRLPVTLGPSDPPCAAKRAFAKSKFYPSVAGGGP